MLVFVVFHYIVVLVCKRNDINVIKGMSIAYGGIIVLAMGLLGGFNSRNARSMMECVLPFDDESVNSKI